MAKSTPVAGEFPPSSNKGRQFDLAKEGRKGYRMMKDAAGHENRLAVKLREGWRIEEDMGDAILISIPVDQAERLAANARDRDKVQRSAQTQAKLQKVEKATAEVFNSAPLKDDEENVDG